jgi:surfactin synthase thioesterase subunit
MTSASLQSSTWIRRFHPHASHLPRLVCFPHAGGSAPFFLPMSAALQGTVDVMSIQYPGRQDRRHEPCVDDIGVLADVLVEVLAPVFDQPVAFFGHSMGALVAFEVALRLRASELSPVALFASGRRAPGRTRSESVHLRDDAGLIAEMRELSGTDRRILGDEEMLRLILPTIRSDYRAVENYRCGPDTVLTCPVDALTGDADPKVTVDDARAWREHTTGPFRIHVLPGGHFFLAQNSTTVVDIVRSHLAAG